MRASFGWEGNSRYGSFHSCINAWMAVKTVKFLDNTCHTPALLWRGSPTKRRYMIKCLLQLSYNAVLNTTVTHSSDGATASAQFLVLASGWKILSPDGGRNPPDPFETGAQPYTWLSQISRALATVRTDGEENRQRLRQYVWFCALLTMATIIHKTLFTKDGNTNITEKEINIYI